MKRSTTLFRLATVLCSVLLVGAFVAYRAGAFIEPWQARTRPMDSGSKQGREVYLYDGTSKSYMIFPSSPQQGPEAAQRAAMMASSKSAVLAEPLTPAPAKRPPTMMGSSKSKAPLIDPSPGPTAPSQPPPPQS